MFRQVVEEKGRCRKCSTRVPQHHVTCPACGAWQRQEAMALILFLALIALSFWWILHRS
jgi:predicted nucleic acid-binding Zn ribbon protein